MTLGLAIGRTLRNWTLASTTTYTDSEDNKTCTKIKFYIYSPFKITYTCKINLSNISVDVVGIILSTKLSEWCKYKSSINFHIESNANHIYSDIKHNKAVKTILIYYIEEFAYWFKYKLKFINRETSFHKIII